MRPAMSDRPRRDSKCLHIIGVVVVGLVIAGFFGRADKACGNPNVRFPYAEWARAERRAIARRPSEWQVVCVPGVTRRGWARVNLSLSASPLSRLPIAPLPLSDAHGGCFRWTGSSPPETGEGAHHGHAGASPPGTCQLISTLVGRRCPSPTTSLTHRSQSCTCFSPSGACGSARDVEDPASHLLTADRRKTRKDLSHSHLHLWRWAPRHCTLRLRLALALVAVLPVSLAFLPGSLDAGTSRSGLVAMANSGRNRHPCPGLAIVYR